MRAALPALLAAADRAAGVDGVRNALSRWFAIYPQPDRAQEEWAAFWYGYTTIIGHLPAEALTSAMQEWAKLPDSQFLPKPGELRDLARRQPTAAFQRHTRAAEAVKIADEQMQNDRINADIARRQTTSDDQAKAIRAMFEDFKRRSMPPAPDKSLRGDEHKDDGLPDIGGKPAPGSNLTPQMLEVLARQAERSR